MLWGTSEKTERETRADHKSDGSRPRVGHKSDGSRQKRKDATPETSQEKKSEGNDGSGGEAEKDHEAAVSRQESTRGPTVPTHQGILRKVRIHDPVVEKMDRSQAAAMSRMPQEHGYGNRRREKIRAPVLCERGRLNMERSIALDELSDEDLLGCLHCGKVFPKKELAKDSIANQSCPNPECDAGGYGIDIFEADSEILLSIIEWRKARLNNG